MAARPTRRPIRRVDVQVSILTAVIVVASCLCVFAFHYALTYNNMIGALTGRVYSIYDYLEDSLDKRSFFHLRSAEDMESGYYQSSRQTFANVKQATGVRYLYTATRNEDGDFIYLVDGLPLDAEDFRRPGDLIEPDIIPELERAMAGEEILPDAIKDTEWGKIFIAYLPIHSSRSGNVVGVVGVEFEAEAQYNTYRTLRIITPCIILLACLVSVIFAVFFFRRISNPTFRDLSNTDQLTQLKNRNAFQVDLKNLTARRKLLNLGLLLLDLNNLKEVNDTLGHDHGDLYLQTVASALSQTAQHGDTPYRTGGDEFVLLVPDATPQRMQAVSARLQALFAALKPDWAVDTSLSTGWAVCDPEGGLDFQCAYQQADERMYEQKRAYHRAAGHDRRQSGD